MKIAISSKGKNLNSLIDVCFGRSPFFIMHNAKTENYNYIDNQIYLNASQDAGVQTDQKIIDNTTKIVIKGNMSQNSFKILTNANIKIYDKKQGTVAEAIQNFNKEKLELITNASKRGHWF